MENKNILIVTNNYPTVKSKRAGVFSKQDADFSLALGKEVTVLVANRYILSPKQFLKSIFDQNIKELKRLAGLNNQSNLQLKVIRYFSLPKPYVYFEDFFLRFVPFKLTKSFDVVLLESMIEPGLLIKWMRRNVNAKKYILREHSDWCRFPTHMQKASLSKIKYFDLILVNSEFMRNNIIDLAQKFEIKKLDRDKILIDFPKFHVNQEIIDKSLNLKYSFLTVANLIISKGFFEMVDLIANLLDKGYDIKWTIVGKGYQKLKIVQYAQEKGIENVISFLEERLQNELAELYKQSNFYIQLTHYETFGITPLEAYTYQCKLVVSDMIPSLNELVYDDDNLFKINKESSFSLGALEMFIEKPFNVKTFSMQIDKIEKAISFSPIG